MTLRPVAVLLHAAVLVPIASAALAPAQDAATVAAERFADSLVAELRAAARDVQYFVRGELAYGRTTWTPGVDAQHRLRVATDAAVRLAGLPDRLVALTEDEEPAVRLLAAYALYQTCEAKYLPVLARLTSDTGEVPMRQRLIGARGPEDFERFHREHPEACVGTVGDEVGRWLAMWRPPAVGTPAFAAWSERQLRCAPTVACLRVELALATHGLMGDHAGFGQPLLAVLRRISSAPAGVKEIAMIGAFHDRTNALGSVHLHFEAHLKFAARRLGRDNLLRVLRGEAPVIAGVALPPENLDGFTAAVASFVLQFADEVGLAPADVPELLALGEKRNDFAFWRAAARLQPAEATTLLRAALTRPTNAFLGLQQMECAKLLWDLAPRDNADFLADWALTPEPGPVRGVPCRLHSFAVHLLSRYRPEDRGMFRRLASDDRFAEASPTALVAILRWLNQTQLDPIVDDEELRTLGHPWGTDRGWFDREKAAADHPRETAAMVATMARWRRAIVDHVRDW